MRGGRSPPGHWTADVALEAGNADLDGSGIRVMIDGSPSGEARSDLPPGPISQVEELARQPGAPEALSLGSAERNAAGRSEATSKRGCSYLGVGFGTSVETAGKRRSWWELRLPSGASIPKPLEESPVMSVVKAVGRGPDLLEGTNPCRALVATSPVRRGGVGRGFTSCGPRPRGFGRHERGCGRWNGLRIVASAISATGLTEGTRTPGACPVETRRKARRGANRQGRGKRRRRNEAGLEPCDEESGPQGDGLRQPPSGGCWMADARSGSPRARASAHA